MLEKDTMKTIGELAENKLKALINTLIGRKSQVITESRSIMVEIENVQFRNPGLSGVEIITPEWGMNEKMEFYFHSSDGNLNNFESEFISRYFQVLKQVLSVSDEVEFTQDGIKKIEISFPAYASE